MDGRDDLQHGRSPTIRRQRVGMRRALWKDAVFVKQLSNEMAKRGHHVEALDAYYIMDGRVPSKTSSDSSSGRRQGFMRSLDPSWLRFRYNSWRARSLLIPSHFQHFGGNGSTMVGVPIALISPVLEFRREVSVSQPLTFYLKTLGYPESSSDTIKYCLRSCKRQMRPV